MDVYGHIFTLLILHVNINNNMSTAEPWPEVWRGQEVLSGLFDDEYWRRSASLPDNRPSRREKACLTSTETKILAANFESSVLRAMSGDLDGTDLPAGSQLKPETLPIGSLVYFDVESWIYGFSRVGGKLMDYDSDYPGQIKFLINSDGIDLIRLAASRSDSEKLEPARLVYRNGPNGWHHNRLSWFATVAPAKDNDRHSLLSFSSVARNTTKDLFQNTFPLARELAEPAVVGETIRSTTINHENQEVEMYQRLIAATIYTEPAELLKNKAHLRYYKSSILGKRALKNLCRTGLFRNPE